MTTATRENIIGDPVDRVDGPLKVTGAAPYPSDFTFPGLTHAVVVQSTIAAGTIRGIDAAEAEAAPGVLAVITHENAPALAEGPMTPLGPSPPFPLRDNRIVHRGQHVAVVHNPVVLQWGGCRRGVGPGRRTLDESGCVLVRDHRADARHGLRLRGVDGPHGSSRDRGLHQDGMGEIGKGEIRRVMCGARHLERPVDPIDGIADELATRDTGLSHRSCSMVIGSERIRRPVAW